MYTDDIDYYTSMYGIKRHRLISQINFALEKYLLASNLQDKIILNYFVL